MSRLGHYLLPGFLLLGACTELAKDPGEVARLAPVDSTVLREPDSVAIGRFASFAVARDRSTFISDQATGRVLLFGPDGTFERQFGAKGSGPGELLGPTQVALLGRDSVLVVMDPRQSAISAFDVASGRFSRRIRVPFREVGQGWAQVGDTAIFGIAFGAATLARWHWPDSLVETVGAVPPSLLEAGPAFLNYGRTEVITFDNGYAAMVPTDPGLLLIDRAGRPTGRVRLPEVRRRGNSADLVARHLADDAAGKPFVYRGSAVAALHRLSNGAIALLFADLDLHPGRGSTALAPPKLYLTILSADLSMACPDRQLVLQTDSPLPFPAFVQDTIVAFARQIRDDGRLRQVIYRFPVSAAGCEMVPTGGVDSLDT